MTNFNPTQAADSHAGMHGDFAVYWSNGNPKGVPLWALLDGIAGWYYIPDNDKPIGPFETSQAAFLAYVAAFDAEVRAGMALG